MVRVRDGVSLASDIYLPEGSGPFPALFERTPYGRHLPSRSEITATDPKPASRAEIAAVFTGAGFAVLYQDCRGRHGSEGRFTKYLGEAEDGFDTAAWLIREPFCDGRIGTFGLSYAAHTQAALGALDPPGLMAQVLDCGGFADAWQSGIRQSGAFEMKQATWAFKQAALSPEAEADPLLKAALAGEDIRAWFARLPWRRAHSPLRHHPDYESYLFEQWRHGASDGFWHRLGLWAEGFHHCNSSACAVHLSSWFDPYAATAVANFLGLRHARRGPQRLILGPWTHGDRSLNYAGDVDFGPHPVIDSWAGDWRRYRLQFFERIFHGAPETEPAVRLFVMGGGSGRRNREGRLDHGGHWISAEEFPPAGVAFRAWYLHGDGGLAPEMPEADRVLAYDFDPARPVPTIGGAFSSLEPLAAPFEFVGPVEVTLFVASDAPDTDFTAKLIDVHPRSEDYPQGYAMLLGDGILRLRYADDPAAPVLNRPGELRRVRIILFPTANLFLPGHRVRLDVSSSNFPKFDVNPNSGEAEGEARRQRRAVNSVFTGPSHPSRIVLPELPG